ncbi:50S ribosome-binding GTPase [Candidatus Saccharibacteria bacterium]|nr:50S ribosome-binding GTPase [Candidatus Saccharibacteria bacterium]
MRLPIVAIIGQTNAGKSSLFNRLARKHQAIVAREAGTTRDSVTTTIDDRYLLVDTAGLKDPSDAFEATIQAQIDDAIDAADLILLVVDGTKYPNHDDSLIATKALRSKKPLLLIRNKSDLKEFLPAYEFAQLGIRDHLDVSATTGYGFDSLRANLDRLLPHAPRSSSRHKDDTTLKIALVGRPNVGKSSLFNTLGKKQQAVVSSRAGTTRDVNRITLRYNNRNLEILDTAGLRRPGKREVGIEKFSAIRTLAAIEEADVCCLLVDSTEFHVKLDQAIAGQIVEAGKGIIFIVTKTDLLSSHEQEQEQNQKQAQNHERKQHHEQEQESPQSQNQDHATPKDATDQILRRMRHDFDFIPYAPVILTSSLTGKNVTKIFELATTIDQNRHQEIKTSDLNKILMSAVAAHPPAGLKNTHPKLRYIVQTDTCPPWFVVYGSNLSLLHWSYKRYLERRLREVFPFNGTPIFFSFRNRD